MRGATFKLVLLLAMGLSLWPAQASAVRLKDMTTVKGVRANQLIGYGLVVGLAGTGDGSSSTLTKQSLASILSRMGITLSPEDIKSKNVAAVIVTASLPPFSRVGARLDVVVSSTGDAKSLTGGTLLLTPLRAPNGQVYAVAQGPLLLGGFSAGGGGSSQTKNHQTVARIPAGGLVEREVPFELNDKAHVELMLRKPDFTTAMRVERAINSALGERVAKARDSGTVELCVPKHFEGRVTDLIARIENVDVQVDQVARVVLNERTGTVIMGSDVRISKVAIAHGSLTLQIDTTNIVSQPNAFSQKGETVTVPQTNVEAREEGTAGLSVIQGATLGEVVGALNALGISPRDLITILQAIRAAGALQAEIELI